MILSVFAMFLIGGILGRQAGGGLGANRIWKPLPEICISLFMTLSVLIHNINLGFILSWGDYLKIAAWTYLWYQTGHAVAYTMGMNSTIAKRGRMNLLSYIVNPIAHFLDIELGGVVFSYIFMFLKGFLCIFEVMYYWNYQPDLYDVIIKSIMFGMVMPNMYLLGYHIISKQYGNIYGEFLTTAIWFGILFGFPR